MYYGVVIFAAVLISMVDSQANLLCPDGYFATINSTCSLCPAGKYQHSLFVSTSYTSCFNCPVGTYTTQLGSPSGLSCIVCTMPIQQTGATFCNACHAGTYAINISALSSSSNCKLCTRGTYSRVSASSSCTPCANSMYMYTPDAGASHCITCPPGTHIDNGTANSSSCIRCSPGKFNFIWSPDGPAYGEPCPLVCGGGRYMTEHGSTISSGYECNVCTAGKYAPWYTVNTACTECGVNTFAPVNRSNQCTPCPLGTYSTGTGRTICDQTCIAGTYGVDSPSRCAPCQNGTYSSVAGLSSCTACQSGTYSKTRGATSCLNCPSGMYAPNPASDLCISCNSSSAYVTSMNTSNQCAGCGVGRFAASRVAPSCARELSMGWISRIDNKFYLKVFDLMVTTNQAIVYTGPTMPLEDNAGERRLASTIYWLHVRILGKLSLINTNGSVWVDPSDTVRISGHNYLPGSPLDSVGFLGTMLCNDNLHKDTVFVDGNLRSTFFKFADTNSFTLTTGPDDFAVTMGVKFDNPDTIPNFRMRSVSVTLDSPTIQLGQCATVKFNGELRLHPEFEGVYKRDLRQLCTLYPDDPTLECLGDEIICGTACKLCPRGSYSTALSATACVACDVGSYSQNLGASVCLSCPAGTYASGVSMSACLACDAGSYMDKVTMTACSECPSGQYATSAAQTSCIVCPVGRYAPDALRCLPCPAGSYNNVASARSCRLCFRNAYTETEGQTICIFCFPYNMAYTTAEGATTCTMCSRGTYYSNRRLPYDTPVCTNCDAGTWGGSEGCGACNYGTYSSGVGATACLTCQVGKYQLISSLRKMCDSCPVNTYSTVDISQYYSWYGSLTDYCMNCPAGVYSPPASSVCLNCAPGSAHVGGTCSACGLSNQYAPYHGMTSCMDCPAMTYTSVPNATVAFHCRCLPGYVCQYTPQRFVVGLKHPSLSTANLRGVVAEAAKVAAANVTLRMSR
jgi:hypothetical protein